MATNRQLREENEILKAIVEPDKRLVGQYNTAKQLNVAKKWNSFFIGCGIALFFLFILHYCASDPIPARNAYPPREVPVEH